MEDYLETLITILIGLGVFLISALGKKKSGSKKSLNTGSTLEESPADEDFFSESNTNYPDETEAKEPMIPLSQQYSEQTESSYQNNTAMNEQSSINDPPAAPDLTTEEEKPNKKSNERFSTHLNPKHKRNFNAKTAIIYATIINRKYF